MRPGYLALAIALAVLAVLTWPRTDEGLEAQSTGSAPAASRTSGSLLATVALASVSALMFLQGFRPRSKAVAKALDDGRGP